MNVTQIVATLETDEGFRAKPYLDTTGHWTVGIGWNLDATPITLEWARRICFDQVQTIIRELDNRIPWWREMNDVRQAVFVNMAFNLGVSGLLGFPLMLAAAKLKNYTEAAAQMRDSLWCRQVGQRAIRLSGEMASGMVSTTNPV